MAKVLIDNATISSVQRALGKASLREPSLLDVEHVALARFSEAVLLNERVIIPDNYKSELTASRKLLISGDAFQFQELGPREDDAITKVCSSLAPIWREAFRAGSDRSLFSEYFSQVNAFSNFIWERSSSAFFLVFRAHGIDKASPLIDAVLASPPNEEIGKELQIIGTDGNAVSWDKLSPHVRRMLAVMGWLAHQYLWYQVFAAQHECSYMPHPLRDFFAYDFLTRANAGAKTTDAFASAFTHEIGRFQGRLKQSLEQLGQVQHATTVSLPGFLPLLVRESSNRNDFLRVLNQMRLESDVIALRRMLEEVQLAITRDDYKPLKRMKREIEAVGKNILVQRGLEDRLIKITPPTTVLGIKIEGDDLSVKLRIPAPLYKQFFLHRRYRAFVKRVMEELVVPSQWGELKTKLNSWAWITDDAYPKVYLTKDRFPSLFYKRFREAVEEFDTPSY